MEYSNVELFAIIGISVGISSILFLIFKESKEFL